MSKPPRKEYSDKEFKFITKDEFDDLIDALGYIKLQEMESKRTETANALRKMYNTKDFPALTKAEWDREVDRGTSKASLRELHQDRKDKIKKKMEDQCIITSFSSPRPKPTELRIAMVGKTGDGKSSVANAVLGRGQVFQEGCSAISVTDVSAMGETTWEGIKVRVVDTPGLQDTHRSRKDILREIARIIQLFPNGIHCFLYVLNIARHRFTEEDREVLDDIKELFGVDFVKYVILVYSHADAVKGLNVIDFKKDRINEDQEGANAKFLTELGVRIVAVDTQVPTEYAKSKNQRTILSYVMDTFKKNGDLYTNYLFQKAHGIITGSLDNKVYKIVREYYKKHPQILDYTVIPDNLLNHVKSNVDKDFILSDDRWRGEILTALNSLKSELLHIYEDLSALKNSKLCQTL